MGNLFDNILGGDESLFLNPEHLDYSYQPKLVPFRESQQFYIASCIRPLFEKRDGRNLLIYGMQGVGKTVCCKHVLKELLEETDDISVVYINCWIAETAHKVMLDICNQVGYKWVSDKNTKELMEEATNIMNKKSAVIVLDEFDKLQDYGVLYGLLERLYKKCLLLVTNDLSALKKLEPRIMSRLNIDRLEFKPYNLDETREILRKRKDYAFVKSVFDDDAFMLIADKTFEMKDIRKGLFLMREAGDNAERESSRKIELKHAESAIKKIDDSDKVKIFRSDEHKVLELFNNNPGKSLREIYELYQASEKKSYKTFQRIVHRLESTNALNAKRI